MGPSAQSSGPRSTLEVHRLSAIPLDCTVGRMAGPSFTAEDARSRMAEVLDLVHAKRARVTITYRGKPRAVVLGFEDYQKLQELEKAGRKPRRRSPRRAH